MTPQEQQMLQGLVDRVTRTQLQEKDPEAEQFIQQTLGRNPDALYILAQTVLVQQYALDQAQRQLVDLRGQLAQARPPAQEPKHGGSFLGSLLGLKDEPQQRQAAPPPPPPPPQPMPVQGQYAAAPMYAPSGGYPLPGAPQGGGFLRSAMQTATGVAAGALAFEGIESLMHGFGHSEGGFGGAGMGGPGFGGGRPEEVINNYYGDSSPHEHRGDAASSDAGFYDPSSDASRSSDTSTASNGGSYAADDSGNAGTDADDLSGTAGSNYSADGDDSMLSDDVGDQGSDDGYDSGGDDSGGDSGSDFDSGGGDGGF